MGFCNRPPLKDQESLRGTEEEQSIRDCWQLILHETLLLYPDGISDILDRPQPFYALFEKNGLSREHSIYLFEGLAILGGQHVIASSAED